MSRFVMVLSVWWLATLAGCQCCCLTERYASFVDHVADHEHCFEVLYSPCWDLNRIGRSDWCSCRMNRVFCRCACDRCRPAHCEFCVIAETGRIRQGPVSRPDWAEEAAPPIEPTETIPLDDLSEPVPVPQLAPPPSPEAREEP